MLVGACTPTACPIHGGHPLRLKLVCVVSAFAQAFAMAGRLAPYQVGEQTSAVGIVVVYVAQLIIGMTGPIVMVSAVHTRTLRPSHQ